MRIMAIDYGESRIGIAITDPLGIISQPLLTLRNSSDKDLIERLKCIIKEKNIGIIIIGNPLSLKGSATGMSKKIEFFKEKLQNHVTIEIQLWDERFTSKYALAIARQLGFKVKKSQLDRIAACLMLDEFLKSKARCSA